MLGSHESSLPLEDVDSTPLDDVESMISGFSIFVSVNETDYLLCTGISWRTSFSAYAFAA